MPTTTDAAHRDRDIQACVGNRKAILEVLATLVHAMVKMVPVVSELLNFMENVSPLARVTPPTP